jgi:hypothetical protein
MEAIDDCLLRIVGFHARTPCCAHLPRFLRVTQQRQQRLGERLGISHSGDHARSAERRNLFLLTMNQFRACADVRRNYGHTCTECLKNDKRQPFANAGHRHDIDLRQ